MRQTQKRIEKFKNVCVFWDETQKKRHVRSYFWPRVIPIFYKITKKNTNPGYEITIFVFFKNHSVWYDQEEIVIRPPAAPARFAATPPKRPAGRGPFSSQNFIWRFSSNSTTQVVSPTYASVGDTLSLTSTWPIGHLNSAKWQACVKVLLTTFKVSQKNLKYS